MKQNNLLEKRFYWVNSLYFMEGLPAAVISQLGLICLQAFGFTNARITFLTGLFTLPWSLKLFFSVIPASYGRNQSWIFFMQLGIAIFIFLIGLLISPNLPLFWISLAFILLATCACFNDIVTDGIYLTQLSEPHQRFYIGLRSIAYQAAGFLCAGLALWWLTKLEQSLPKALAWRYLFMLIAVLATALAFWHKIALAQMPNTIKTLSFKLSIREVFLDLAQLPKRNATLLFIFLYHAPYAILIKIFPLFFLDNLSKGGLNFNAAQYGIAYSIGLCAMLLGVFLAGYLLLQFKLQRLYITCNLLFALSFLSFTMLKPNLISTIVFYTMNQFFYGLCSASYMLFLTLKTKNTKQSVMIYAIFTTCMMLSLSLFGMLSGVLQQYLHFQGTFLFLSLGVMGLSFLIHYNCVGCAPRSEAQHKYLS